MDRPLIKNSRGGTLVEYGILAGLVSVVALASVSSLGTKVKNTFDVSAEKLAENSPSNGTPGLPGGPGGPGGPGDDSGSTAPADPYAGYYDPDTFLIGTSEVDSLNIAFTSYKGIMALEGNDRLDAGSAGGIMIGHKGDDTIITSSGNDTFVFAAGDGSDFIRTGSGNDSLVFPNLNASEATFHSIGPDMEIYWSSGDKVTIDEIFYNRAAYGIELFRFADRDFTFEQALERTQEDDKSVGTVYASKGPDNFIHRKSQDPNYTIRGYADGVDSLTFEESNFADVRITRPGQSHIIVHDGGQVYIMEYLWDQGWIENIVFKDGPRTREEIWQKSLEDSKATGNVHMSRFDDYFTHSNGDGEYFVTGSFVGTDELVFLNQSSASAGFGKIYNHLIITTDAGDKITIDNYLGTGSTRGWLETIRFTDGVWTPDMFQARIDSGG